MPVLLTIAHSITDQINFLASQGNPSEFEMRRVKKEIEQVKNSDIAQYYMLLGMFYSVVGDIDESRRNHECSLRLNSELIFIENYAFSLKRLGATPDALDLLLKAFDQTPTEEVLEEVAQAMLYAGDFTCFESANRRFEKANPNKKADICPSVSYISTVFERLDRADVGLDDYRRSMGLVTSVLAQQGLISAIEAITFGRGYFDEVPHLDIILKVRVSSSDRLFEANEAIAEAMSSAEDIEAWNRLVFTVCDQVEHNKIENEVA